MCVCVFFFFFSWLRCQRSNACFISGNYIPKSMDHGNCKYHLWAKFHATINSSIKSTPLFLFPLFVVCFCNIYFSQCLKGALDNFSFIPRFFPKSWDFYTISSVYLRSDCMLIILLQCIMQLQLNYELTKICEFFLQRPFYKSLLLNMAATVMIVEFGTIHHYSSLDENSKACLCSSLNRYKN